MVRIWWGQRLQHPRNPSCYPTCKSMMKFYNIKLHPNKLVQISSTDFYFMVVSFQLLLASIILVTCHIEFLYFQNISCKTKFCLSYYLKANLIKCQGKTGIILKSVLEFSNVNSKTTLLYRRISVTTIP